MSDIIASELTIDEKNDWGKDPIIFNAMNKEFNFFLDAAASNNNCKCAKYLTKRDNALNIDWSELVFNNSRRSVWINPPYGRGYIKSFMNKSIEQSQKGLTIVMLVPATLDAQWLPIDHISEIRILTGGRLSFYHPITNHRIW